MKPNKGERSADIDLGFFDLNTVSESDLANLPFVGLDRARDLIGGRPFTNMDDVRRVPGVTEDFIDQLVRSGATVGDTPQVRKAA